MQHPRHGGCTHTRHPPGKGIWKMHLFASVGKQIIFKYFPEKSSRGEGCETRCAELINTTLDSASTSGGRGLPQPPAAPHLFIYSTCCRLFGSFRRPLPDSRDRLLSVERGAVRAHWRTPTPCCRGQTLTPSQCLSCPVQYQVRHQLYAVLRHLGFGFLDLRDGVTLHKTTMVPLVT